MKKLSVMSIALKNLKHQKKRSILFVILISLLSFTLLSGLTISSNLKNGINTMSNRFGADLMIVPIENTDNMQGILLQGTPSTFYFDKILFEKIKEVEGIDEITSQFYLQSLSASCCSVPVQIIGYDPDTDFSVAPWIASAYSNNIEKGQIVVGSDIYIDQSRTLKLFNTRYDVAAQLNKTGTGLDSSVYIDINMLPEMYADAISVGVEFESNENPEESVSTILVNVDDSHYKEKVVHDIYEVASDLNIDINIVESQDLTQELAKSINNLSTIFYIYSVIFILITYISLYIVFSLIINERKKEFSIMRIIGATKKAIMKSVLLETFIISISGGIIGSIISLLLTSSFNRYIEATLELPYIDASITSILLLLLLDILICAIVGPLAALGTVSQINKAETFITMKEGD